MLHSYTFLSEARKREKSFERNQLQENQLRVEERKVSAVMRVKTNHEASCIKLSTIRVDFTFSIIHASYLHSPRLLLFFVCVS